MQSNKPLNGMFNDGLDSELDTIGINLESSVVCGKCRVKMDSKDNIIYTCPVCNSMFKDE